MASAREGNKANGFRSEVSIKNGRDQLAAFSVGILKTFSDGFSFSCFRLFSWCSFLRPFSWLAPFYPGRLIPSCSRSFSFLIFSLQLLSFSFHRHRRRCAKEQECSRELEIRRLILHRHRRLIQHQSILLLPRRNLLL